MAFQLELTGTLCFADAAAATLARAAMLEGRAGNAPLEEGTRVVGDTIVFSFDGQLASDSAPAIVDGCELGIAKALENALTGSVTYSDQTGSARTKHALGPEFWKRRWEDKQTGFHEGAPNALLAAHAARLDARPSEARAEPLRVLVPLAGKAVDMKWLAERGSQVVGVEVYWGAVRAFFDEQELAPPVVGIDERRSLSANGVTLVCADIFDITPAMLGTFDAVYDRAALVALEPSTRARYVATLRKMLAEHGVIFLVAFAYDQTKTQGPPWSIDEATVRSLYAPAQIEILEKRAVSASKRLADAGVPTLEETAYLVRVIR